MTKLLAALVVAASLGGCVTKQYSCNEIASYQAAKEEATCKRNWAAEGLSTKGCRIYYEATYESQLTTCRMIEAVGSQPSRPAFDVYIRN